MRTSLRIGGIGQVSAAIRFTLIITQLAIAAFFASSAILMWGPFVAGTLSSKLLVAAIVCWPIIALVALSRGDGFLGLGLTSTMMALTVAHIFITLAIIIAA